tara:strand:- start:1980 stop:2285 length:306 start_codon:yes stop_codon:yes gene_type:complete
MVEIFSVPSNMTSVIDLLPFASTITQGILGVVLLITLGSVTWMVTSAFNPKQSFVTTGFILAISSAFMWILGLVSPSIFYINVIIFIIALAIVSSTGKSNA